VRFGTRAAGENLSSIQLCVWYAGAAFLQGPIDIRV
jgi:hypothetical protein